VRPAAAGLINHSGAADNRRDAAPAAPRPIHFDAYFFPGFFALK
jgi:hypothetical protein